MNKLCILIPLSLIPLAVVPLASAQLDTSSLGNIGQSITDGLSNLWNTATTFATSQPEATGTITTLGASTGIGAIGWKFASKGKKAAETAANYFKEKLTGAESTAASATEQLNAYKAQAETQLSTIQTDAQKQIAAYKAQAESATGLQSKLEELTQQKASYQNQVEELTARLKTAQDQLAVLTPKIK